MNMRTHAASLAVWLLSGAVLLASCDQQTDSRNVEAARCVADLEKTPGTATRLLSGKEIETCIRGKMLSFYSSNGAYLNRSESFLSDGMWVVDRHMAILDTRIGQWKLDHDKVCVMQAESGAYCRAIMFNQQDQTLFMRGIDPSVADRGWPRITIESSAYEGHMGKP